MKTKQILYLFIYLCIHLIVSNLSNAYEEWTYIVEKVKPSVITIVGINESGEEIITGSGFFISENKIVTSRHVIEKVSNANIKTNSGLNYPIQGFLSHNQEHDIVILYVDTPDYKAIPLKLSDNVPKEGQDILVIGSPLGLEQTVSSGIVSSIRELPGFGTLIQVTAPISPGSSGGPIFDRNGEVVAIVNSYLVSGQNLNFSLPIMYLKELKEETVKPLFELTKIIKEEKAILYEDEMLKAFYTNMNKDYNQSILHYREALHYKPDEAIVYVLLGDTYKKVGKLEDAIKNYEQAITVSPEYIGVYSCIGECYHDLGQYQKSINAFLKYTSFKPDDAIAFYNLGICYLKINQYLDAINSFKRSIIHKSDSAEAFYSLGVSYNYMGNVDDAINAYRQAIKLSPNHVNAHANLCYLYLSVNKRESAMEEYQKIRKLDLVTAEILLFEINKSK